MKNRIWAALVALALMVGGALALSLPAAAHTGDLSVVAVCNTQTGQYDLTATLTISQTSLSGATKWDVGTASFAGTPSNANALTQGPIITGGAGTITLGTFSLPGTTTGKGPWVYAYTSWTDGFGKGSDGQLLTNLAGDCSTPPVVVGPNFIETSHVQYCGGVDVTLHSVNPWIYPTSVVIDGVHSYGPTVDNRTGGTLSGPQKDATKTRTITFPEDSGTHTVSYRVDAGSENTLYVGLPVGTWTDLVIETNCAADVVIPNPPVVKDVCGAGNDHLGLPDVTAGIDYSRDGLDIVATLSSSLYVFGTLPAGWVLNLDGTATFAFNPADFTDEPCSTKPDTKVENGEWSTGEYECGDTTVEETRIVSTTTYEWVNDAWKGTTAESTETRERDLTVEEIAALECELPTPLAFTGSTGIAPAPLFAGGVLLLAGIGFLAWRKVHANRVK